MPNQVPHPTLRKLSFHTSGWLFIGAVNAVMSAVTDKKVWNAHAVSAGEFVVGTSDWAAVCLVGSVGTVAKSVALVQRLETRQVIAARLVTFVARHQLRRH